MTTAESVQHIANELAEMEKRANKNAAGARDLRQYFKDISENGDAPPLLTSKYYAEIVAVTTANAAALLDLHHRMTEDAKSLGIDIPDAQPVDDGIGILSGGGR